MKGFSSILAWLLLAAVLAVPSFLFYNWWSKSKRQASSEVASAPVTVNVFPSDRQPGAAPQQPAPAPQPQPADQPQAAPAAQPAPAQPQAQAAPAQPEPQPSASAQPPEAPAAAPEAAPQGEAPAAEASTETRRFSYYEPKGDRDPTYSPEDYRRIKEEQRQREEAERALLRVNRKAPEPGPETRITLQGIVGSAAIINGDMYAVGQTVKGIRILKVGADYIIGECVTGSCKGKRFRKVMK